MSDIVTLGQLCISVIFDLMGGLFNCGQVNTVQASIVPPTAEEAKKKELASQLFGGLSGPSRAPRSRQQRKSGKCTVGVVQSIPS